MRVYICVKTVPDNDQIVFDSETGNMIRGSSAVINPYDLQAVEAGCKISALLSCETAAVSMGPSSAEAGLRYAISMGVTSAELITGKGFGGADTLSTAQTLAAFFKRKDDIGAIVCGKHSSDGDTGQVGPELSQMLGIAHAGCVIGIERITESHITVRQRMDDSIITLRLPMPCLLVIENDFTFPRSPTLVNTIKSKRCGIKHYDAGHFDADEMERFGISGSSTRVVKLSVLKRERQVVFIEGGELRGIIDRIRAGEVNG